MHRMKDQDLARVIREKMQTYVAAQKKDPSDLLEGYCTPEGIGRQITRALKHKPHLKSVKVFYFEALPNKKGIAVCSSDCEIEEKYLPKLDKMYWGE